MAYRTYTVFCEQSNGCGTTWIDTVNCRTRPGTDGEDDLERIGLRARKECARDWYDDPEEIDGIVCVGIAKGNVRVLEWDDSHRGEG